MSDVRAYRGPADLCRMQDLVARRYAETHLRVGDLAWLVRAYTQPELTERIRLWNDETGELRGWTFHRDNGGFNVFPALGLLPDVLDVIDSAGGRYTYGIPPTSGWAWLGSFAWRRCMPCVRPAPSPCRFRMPRWRRGRCTSRWAFAGPVRI
jgi:hypothetical protein